MKELSIEEKALRYDEVIERANSLLSGNQLGNDWVYALLPELKESEDERIRKWLIALIKSNEYGSISNVGKMPCPKLNVLAWLEKQGENNMGISEATKQKLDDNLNKALEKETPESWNEFLEDQGEHKPADEVEPKFKVGDWTLSRLDGKTRQILGVHYDKYNNYYAIEDNEYNIKEYDRLHNLWSIQYAKDGDILATDSGRPFICKGLLDVLHPESPVAYCGIDYFDDFRVCNNLNRWTGENVHPATEEQRELLFQKMQEAGYEWVSEKGLHKIEDYIQQKPY